jgi:hypothetical protein
MTKKRKKITLLKRFEKNEIVILTIASLAIIALLLGVLLAQAKHKIAELEMELTRKQTAIENIDAELALQIKDLAECKSRFIKKVEIRKNADGGYAFYVKGKPFLIKGVGYNPVPIGEGYDHDFFADENKPWKIDGPLMQEAGINALRIYNAGEDLTQVIEFIRYMYENHGIYTAMSDWLGLWDYPRANYADSEFREKTKKRILKIVSALKNEPGLLMWILGNENNYTFSGQIGFWTSPEIEKIKDPRKKIEKRAQIYYEFVEDIAKAIKEIDTVHPVALGNGEAQFIDTAAKICKNVDLLAIIAYRGKTFGNLFPTIRNTFDKPIVLSEFGCDSYDAYRKVEDQEVQKDFTVAQWEEIYAETVLSGNLSGNVLGGFLFEWTDEWWKHNEGYRDDWSIHNTEAGWQQSSYFFDIRAESNLNMNEEWFGIVSISPETESGVNKRLPKKSYYALKEYFSRISPQP